MVKVTMKMPWRLPALLLLLGPSKCLAKTPRRLVSNNRIGTQVGGCRHRSSVQKASKAPSGKGKAVELKKISVSNHSMKKSSKSTKTKSPGHSIAPAAQLPIFCDEYCDSLDDPTLSTALYRIQLTLSILDTVEATGDAIEDLFDSIVASEISPVCQQFGARRNPRRLQDGVQGTILQVDFAVSSNPDGDCSPVDADTTLTGMCANYFVDASIQYDTGDSNQFQAVVEEAVSNNCEAIASLDQVEEAFDPCPYVSIVPLESNNGDGEDPDDIVGNQDDENPQQGDDNDSEGTNTGSPDGDSGQGTQNGGSDENSGGSDPDGDLIFAEGDPNDQSEGGGNESQGPAALKSPDTDDDDSAWRKWPWIIIALCALIICCTYCCLFAFQVSRRDNFAHKKLGDEEDEDKLALQKGIWGSLLPDQSSGEDSTVDTSSPGRPGIRSWDGSDGQVAWQDDKECPSSNRDGNAERDAFIASNEGINEARSTRIGTNGNLTFGGSMLEDPCGRLQDCCYINQGTNASISGKPSGYPQKRDSQSIRSTKAGSHLVASLIDDATSVDDEWDEAEFTSVNHHTSIQPAVFTITDNLGETQPHQNVHRCTSALCQLCGKNKEPQFVSVRAPPSPPSIPRDATRDYSLDDSVSL